jgi:hypothetical protein
MIRILRFLPKRINSQDWRLIKGTGMDGMSRGACRKVVICVRMREKYENITILVLNIHSDFGLLMELLILFQDYQYQLTLLL